MIKNFLYFPAKPKINQKITSKKFKKLITSFSEKNGEYEFDNWITNERNYLNIVEPLLKENVKGGAYIGVGPCQNFTFIEAIKPDIAFIVDIRRQMLIQHLIYKALFEKANTRINFFSLLFSKPLPSNYQFDKDATIDQLVDLLYKTKSDKKMITKTMKKVTSILIEKYKFELDQDDEKYIQRTMSIFYLANLNIAWNMNENNYFIENKYVRLWEILKSVDKNGDKLNIFNSEKKYQFIRKMHLENRIIPITGDFAGKKALKKISNYLRKNKLFISAFYTSSVELWLFKYHKFESWVENVKYLTINENSVFIRQNLMMKKHHHSYQYDLHNINNFLKSLEKGINKYEELYINPEINSGVGEF